MDFTMRLNAETRVGLGNVQALNRAVITTYDVTLTCQLKKNEVTEYTNLSICFIVLER